MYNYNVKNQLMCFAMQVALKTLYTGWKKEDKSKFTLFIWKIMQLINK